NVIADWTGSERPEQIITVGGHIDSWDNSPGAIDDGAGMAITMSSVKLMIDQGLRPKRTIRVIFYGAEEVSQPDGVGLAGANHYAKSQGEAIHNHIITSESDFGADVVYALRLPAG